MAKHKKNIFSSKWIRWGVFPLILLCFWVGMSLFYFQSTFGITSLTSSYNIHNLTKYSTSELRKGDMIQGEFRAAYNHLGIVLVRFNTFYRISNDFVIFRIKEKGQKNWFYENNYKVDQFQPNKLFTFGFPVIPDSGGNTYVFEIESVQGEKNDAVAISTIEPVFVAKYQYPRSEITGTPGKTISFGIAKTINSLTNPDFIVTTFAYLLPLFLYLFYNIFIAKFSLDRYILVFIPLVVLFVESFFTNNTNDILVLTLTVLMAFTIYISKLESRITFTFALLFLICTPVMFAVGQDKIAENFAMWAYMLLVIGAFQAVWELKSTNKKLISLSEFAQKIGIKKNRKK